MRISYSKMIIRFGMSFRERINTMDNLKNTCLRFNLDKPLYKKAWDYLHSIDKEHFKSLNHAVAVAVTDYFERYYRNKDDPYFENREREEDFVKQIIGSVEHGLNKLLPNYLTACLAGAAKANMVQSPILKQAKFTKDGIKAMIDEISNGYDNETETLDIIVNGVQMTVPFCADNVNAIDYLLKEMYIAEHTGVETHGNNKFISALLEAKYNLIDAE